MLSLLAIGTAISCLSFFAVWMISVRVRNYGFLDVAWSYAVAVLAPLYALFGPGDPLRKWLAAAIGVAWSLRLGTYLLRRVLRHHPQEDPRYETLRKRWPGPLMFLAFFQLQALIAVVFSLPFLFMAFNQSPGLAPLEIAGLSLAALSLAGEALADAQMKRFKADPANRGGVCNTGLWRYSRHPNYFFESMVWWGFFLAALASPFGWITLACPLLMLYFLLKVTGIDLTEAHSLRTRGEAYRRYQQSTSAFIPWFPKNPS
jgi:steroid 5-alpha reductase family enzyme